LVCLCQKAERNVLEIIRTVNHTVFLLKMGHRSLVSSRVKRYFYILRKVEKGIEKQFYEKKNGGHRAFTRIIGKRVKKNMSRNFTMLRYILNSVKI
jgi:hypothetical protein